MKRLLEEIFRRPFFAFLSGIEMLAESTESDLQIDGFLSRIIYGLSRPFADENHRVSGNEVAPERVKSELARSALAHDVTRSTARADSSARARGAGALRAVEPDSKERTRMDKDLSDDLLKLVRYKVLFVKREYEHAFPEREALVSDWMDGAAFTAWKTAEFIQELQASSTAVPQRWRDKNYPPSQYVKDGKLLGLCDDDKKYLRVFYEVLERYPREKFKYEEQQIRVLEEIRDNLIFKEVAEERHAETEPLPATLAGHAGQVNGVAFSPDGHTLVSGSADASVRLWDVRTLNQRSVASPLFDGKPQPVTSAAFSPDAERIILAHHADKGLIVSAADLQAKIELVGHKGFIPQAIFSPDGTKAATASLDLTARVWDARNGKKLQTLRGHVGSAPSNPPRKIPNGVWTVAFSPDGSRLATGASDATVRLWDLKTGKQIKTFEGHSHLVFTVAFAPDGKTLASGSEDTTIILWKIKPPSRLATFSGHEGWIVSVAFSPDGRTLASGSYDQTIRLWDVPTVSLRTILKGNQGPVHGVAFSPDGTKLASAGNDGTIKLWNV